MIRRIVFPNEVVYEKSDNVFVTPFDGFHCQGLHDFETDVWNHKPRMVEMNFKKGGLPETIPLTSHPEFCPLSKPWQEFLFECLKWATKGTFTYEQLIEAWTSLIMDGRSHFDDHAPENGFRDYITGRNMNSTKGDIAIKCLGFGGNRFKLKQGGFYGTRYKIETLNGSEPPPLVEKVWGTHFIMRATEITMDELPNGTWIVGRFPQLKPYGTPMPLISTSGECYVDANRVRRLEKGEVYSPYNPYNA